MEPVSQDRGLRWYAAREPIILAILTLLAFGGFVVVGALTNLYHKDQQFRGTRWYNRGNTDLTAGQWQRAVTDFHTALLFSRDNYSYELGLAEALAAQGGARKDQAYVYLLDLWQRQPENGTVNLELARISAAKGEQEQALRYYHSAIYAVWGSDSDAQRRAVRFELVEYLLHDNALTLAEAELIAMSGDLPPNVALHVRVGDLFIRTQDYAHAITEYRQALKIDRQSSAALAGIGHAAFQMGNYSLAQHYLQEAVAAGADGGSAQLLETANLVLRMDPFRREIRAAQRARIVVDAFNLAGDRLKTCALPTSAQAANPPAAKPANGGPSTPEPSAPGPSPAEPSLSEPSLSEQWSAMKPKITEANLQRDSDLLESAMDLVFTIERETNSQCGTPSGPDLALLLISKLHEGS